MKKFIFLLLCLIMVSCFVEPKKENPSKIDTLQEDTVIKDNNLMTIDILEDLMLKSNTEFKSWVKDNGYSYFDNGNADVGSYSKKDDVISFTTDKNYEKVISIKYETKDKNTFESIIKSYDSKGYLKIRTNKENTHTESILLNGKFELTLTESIADSLKYKIGIQNQ